MALLGLALGAPAAWSAGYEELRAAAVESCRAIDPAEYRSGLLFNPDGHHSYYVRSECFQRTAVQFRDVALCAEVKRRYALFSSSWGYSARRCRELVAEGTAADRAHLEEIRERHRLGAVRLRDFRIERNGNGRDYVDGASELRIFLRQAEIRQQIPDFALGRAYTVRATLVLDLGHGGPAGYRSDAFVEAVFPARERSQSVEREVRF